MGYVNLKLNISEFQLSYPIPFVVDENKIPCCSILGANFLSHNNVVLDFASGSLGVNNDSGMLVYPSNALTKRESPDYIHSYYHCSFMGVVQMG